MANEKTAASLGNQAHLTKVDALMDLNIATIIPLPQVSSSKRQVSRVYYIGRLTCWQSVARGRWRPVIW
jgi:hypothetical protein